MKCVLQRCMPAALLLVSLSVSAHHAGVTFDHNHMVVATGVVKEFRWSNPHSYLYLEIPNGHGGNDLWSLEMPTLNVMARNGWTSHSLKPGDNVHCLVAPNKDGSTSGSVESVRLDDGKVLHFGGF